MTKHRKLATTSSSGRQLELPVFAGNVDWFVMLAGELKRGLIGELGVHNFAVWCALRSNANLDGRIYATIKTLQLQTKMSKPTVIKAIAFLEDRQLLQVLRDEKHHRYYVIDHIPYRRIHGEDRDGAVASINEGQPDGVLTVRYVPKTAARDRADIQHFLMSGAPPSQNPNIQLVKATTQLVMGDQHVHVYGDLHIHLPATSTTTDDTKPRSDDDTADELSPFHAAAARMIRMSEERLQSALQDKVLPVKPTSQQTPDTDGEKKKDRPQEIG